MNNSQPVLIECIDDGALLFAPDERRKRYTAEQAAELERLHDAVCMLLPAWPVEDIARNLKLSTRTVRALAARESEKVAGFNKDFSEMLLRTGARWIGLARTKEGEASFRDLNIGAGIVMDHARELLALGQVAAGAETKEVEEDHVQAALELRRLMEAASSPASAEPKLLSVQSEPVDSESAVGDLAGGRGGGSGGLKSETDSMDPCDGGSQAKGSL